MEAVEAVRGYVVGRVINSGVVNLQFSSNCWAVTNQKISNSSESDGYQVISGCPGVSPQVNAG